MVDFDFETEGAFVPGATTEWDVFSLLPGGDYEQPEYLATLYSAFQKTIRVELDGSGAGSFAINRTSPECTETILAQGNLVKVRIPEIHDDYIFAFFLETGDFTLISSQEAGGETLTFAGRGILSYLEYARAWSESYIDGGQDPIAGVWRAYAAGTGSAPGQILRRLIDEFQDPDRPQFPIPHLTVDFDYDDDSTADPWDTTDATDEFAYQVGEDGLAIVQRLIDTQTITVQMSPDFVLSAYNPDNYGRDLSGDAFGADIVRFERGVNIATELRRELAVTELQTHMLAAGEDDKYGTAALSDAADRVTKEGFIAAFGTGTTALNGIAAAELQTRLGKSDTIMFPIANRRTADVVLSDPVSIGAPLGLVATDGYYLPGPEGTLGDFWVGDTVRVHTGTAPFDYTEANAVVQAITITREDDNHELIVIPELKTQPTPIECPDDQVQEFESAGGGSDCYIYEVSGIEVEPIDTSSKPAEYLGTTPWDIGALTPTAGQKALLVGGWVFDYEGLGLPGHFSGIPFTSATLTVDQNGFIDGGLGPGGNAPVCVRAHRIITSTTGSYADAVTGTSGPGDYSGDGDGWASQGGIWLAKAGQTPVVVQAAQGFGAGVGGHITVTFADPPSAGNVLIAIASARNAPGSLANTATWDGSLAQICAAPTTVLDPTGLDNGLNGHERYIRMFWKEVCPDG